MGVIGSKAADAKHFAVRGVGGVRGVPFGELGGLR